MPASSDSRFDERLQELFAAALEVSPEERVAFLARECGENSALQRELTELLAAHDDSTGFFEGLSRDIAATAEMELDEAAQPQVRVGSYRTLRVIGQGGMGAVYEAERADGAFDQSVALKLLHLDMQTTELRARFLAERQLLAQLTHPNIARLVDGGVTDEGRPFFAMEFVDGEPITDYCRNRDLSVAQVLRLFLELVEAVSYLHRNLVVHRDLKPSNVFVDRDGRVKLLDFGVAKLLADGESTPRTVTGEQLLTPQYAAPEQILHKPVTTATDVFSLGVLLYELLTGSRPHERTLADFANTPHKTATAPSVVLKARRSVESKSAMPHARWRRIAGDLDTICLKALRPEPERRYASADQMGLDIERHLDGLPVRARRSTFGYRLGKFADRNRAAVSSGLLLLILLGLGFARERRLRDRAQEEAVKAEAVSEFLGTLISSADPARAQGDQVSVLEVLARSEEALEERKGLADRPAVEASIRVVLGRTYQGLGRVADAERQLHRALELAGGVESGNATALKAAEGLGANRTGDYEKREAYLRQVLEVRTRSLGPEHEDTLGTASILVPLLRARGRLEEAEALGRASFEKLERGLGPEHPSTLLAANALAGVLYDQARFLEAADLYARALEISERILGSRHPESLRLMSNLGAAYSAAGRYREAESLKRAVVEERLRVLGDRHHQTGMSMHNLGALVLSLGRPEEAKSWFRRAVEAREDLGGAGYLFSKSHLADVLRELGELQEAEKIYLETLAAQRKSLAPEHPDIFRTMTSLAELRRLQGRLDEAKSLAEVALKEQLKTEGEKLLNATVTLLVLAKVEQERGSLDEALELADRALAMQRDVLGDDHPDALETRLAKARILLAKGSLEQARAEMEGLDVALVDMLGQEHPRAREARALSMRMSAMKVES